MIQAYYKYRPASMEALALLVYADGKDRITQMYYADMLRVIANSLKPAFQPPRLFDLQKAKPRKAITQDKASGFVDDMIARFKKGGKR